MVYGYKTNKESNVEKDNLYEGISVDLGRKKKIKDASGKDSIIQNINVSYKGNQIINEDYETKNMVVKIFPDINEAVVGNIFLPEEYRGKKLAKEIYQAVADKLNTTLVNSLKRKDRLGEYYDQSEAGSRIWKNRESFVPNAKKHPEIQDKKSGGLEKTIQTFSCLSIIGGFLLGTFSITGNAIGNLKNENNFLGVVLIVLGIVGLFISRKI